jgi:hypothetical protein
VLSTFFFQQGVSPFPAYDGQRDTTLDFTQPTLNFGTIQTVRLNGSPGTNNGLLFWDTSLIAAGAHVSDVAITITITDGSASTYQIRALKRRWVETQATWTIFANAQPWQVPGGTGANDRNSVVVGEVTGAPGRRTFVLNDDGLEAVQAWIDDPTKNFGLILDNPAATDNLVFRSRETPISIERPLLVITFTGP